MEKEGKAGTGDRLGGQGWAEKIYLPFLSLLSLYPSSSLPSSSHHATTARQARPSPSHHHYLRCAAFTCGGRRKRKKKACQLRFLRYYYAATPGRELLLQRFAGGKKQAWLPGVSIFMPWLPYAAAAAAGAHESRRLHAYFALRAAMPRRCTCGALAAAALHAYPPYLSVCLSPFSLCSFLSFPYMPSMLYHNVCLYVCTILSTLCLKRTVWWWQAGSDNPHAYISNSYTSTHTCNLLFCSLYIIYNKAKEGKARQVVGDGQALGMFGWCALLLCLVSWSLLLHTAVPHFPFSHTLAFLPPPLGEIPLGGGMTAWEGRSSTTHCREENGRLHATSFAVVFLEEETSAPHSAHCSLPSLGLPLLLGPLWPHTHLHTHPLSSLDSDRLIPWHALPHCWRRPLP